MSLILLGATFILLSLITLTLPGLFLLSVFKIKFDNFLAKFTVSSVLGICTFTLSAYALSAVHLKELLFIFPLVGCLGLLKYRKTFFDVELGIEGKLRYVFLLILIVGMIGQVMINAPSGMQYQDGIYFWSSHGHDGVWHLSLMEEMKKDVFPFQNPELSGYMLQNYHFFVDLLMSSFGKMYGFLSTDLYFRFFPILFSLLMGLGGYILVRKWQKSDMAGLWSMGFIYFAGSLGYLLSIPRSGNLQGEAIFWVTQTQSVLGNPPHASAFIILMVFLFCVIEFLNYRSIKYLFLSAFLGGVVIEFKVYAGLLVLGGLLVLACWEAVFKRQFLSLWLFVITLVIALAIYLPNSANSQDFLIFEPWWFIRTMVVAPDRLDWLDLELRRQTYIAEHNWKRVIQLESTAFLIFLFGNLGMRFIGFWTIGKYLIQKKFDSFNAMLVAMTFAAFFIPVIFLQKGVAWNAIQFNQYFLLLFGFFASASCADLLNKLSNVWAKRLFVVLVFVLAVPTQIGVLYGFYSGLPLSKISFNELDALKVLEESSEQNDIVLTPAFDRYAGANYYPPKPIYAWYDTGYVSAFSRRRTLIADEEQVNIMGYKIDELLKKRRSIFESNKLNEVINDLKTHQVKFVYLIDKQQFAVPIEDLPLNIIYNKDGVRVYKVNM